MLKTIDGFCYLSFVQSGIRNLAKNKQKLNDLNVFPVPDGDTGTNMLMTLRYGYDAVKTNGHLGDVANQLASYAVFGARGNSGVIVSQFFKGVASSLRDCPTADCSQFAKALVSGYKYAYKAVLKPVEGTMLTVLREAADQLVRDSLDSFDDLVHQYLHYAKQCLQRTPDMLPVLKKAGVVDSGASGIVCFFEGVSSFLTGEEIVIEDQDTPTQNVDLTQFDRHSRFPYGYCIEGVLQLNVEVERFDQARLQGKLASSGDSIVMTIE
ncbi:MAG: DAK2 domain-containing protein [Clostridia bacterium]|nr:DAK2 domain-containing protein [Clostridia bacterium]